MFGNTFDNVIRIVLTTFIFSAAIMPVMKRIAHHIGAVDVPRSTEGNRHIHNKPIPKLGGLGIFLGFLFGYMCFGVHSLQMNSILIGSFIIILTGINWTTCCSICHCLLWWNFVGQYYSLRFT